MAESFELGSQAIRVNKEGYEIGTMGIKDLVSGEFLQGYDIREEDLDYGDDQTVLGNGASGFVYLVTHKITG